MRCAKQNNNPKRRRNGRDHVSTQKMWMNNLKREIQAKEMWVGSEAFLGRVFLIN